MYTRGWWSTHPICALSFAAGAPCSLPGCHSAHATWYRRWKARFTITCPRRCSDECATVDSFAGVLALDKWTCNADGRQVAFWKRPRERKFNASFIDQGYFFNAGEWSFPDAPLRGVFGRNDVYAGITEWDSFEPWLSRIESFPESSLWPLINQIPPEWYGSAADELERLLAQLLERRSRVRELILSFKNSSRNPFPNWREASSVAVATSLRPRGQ